jgi:glycosyltransferase involved in cell wall biosynthesis
VRGSNRVKRLGIFVEHFPPFLGSDRTVFELAKRIADTGVQVHFIATQPLRYLIGQRPPDWEYKDNWSRPPPKVHKNITAEYLMVGRRTNAVWRRFNPLAYLLTIIQFTVKSIRTIVGFNPSVVVVANASPIVGIVGFLSTKLTNKPLLIGCPDWMSAYVAGLTNTRMNSLGPVLIQLVEFSLYQWADRVVAVTDFLNKLLIAHGLDSRKIVVIPNGADTVLFNPDVDCSDIRKKYRLENRIVVLFTGHLEDWAGIDLIHDLAKQLNQEVPNSTILLVGKGAATSKLFDRLIHSNLGHMVTHAGLQPYQDMPLFTAAADVALCLFPNTPVSHAASPLKLFEYLASGKAVVATCVSGTTEVLDSSSGMLVAPGNTKEICDAVVNLCSDPSLRNALGNSGRKLIEEKYSWEKLGHRFLDECESLVSRK